MSLALTMITNNVFNKYVDPVFIISENTKTSAELQTAEVFYAAIFISVRHDDVKNLCRYLDL